MRKLILLIIAASFVQLSAQSNSVLNKSFYLSGNLGVYKSSGNTVMRNGGTGRIGGGIGLGFRILENMMFYARAQYISRSDFYGYYDNTYLDTDLKVVNNIGTANASVSQLIVNTGLQYNIYLSKELTLGILGGLTHTMIDQEAINYSGNIIRRINNEWFNGYFGGATIEKSFRDSDLTLFAEALYNYIDDNSLYFRDAFSGMNFTVGGRYYMGKY